MIQFDGNESSPTDWCEPLTKRRSITPLNVKFSNEDVQNYLFGMTMSQGAKGSPSVVSCETPTCREELPNIVCFCISSVPGAGFGIQASQIIPEGAWVGPYKGRLVRPEENVLDTSDLWEIFRDGKLQGYIDGSDSNSSSWMRFIRCARHRQEQNLYAFQYREKIYYRAFKTINPGQELLVWYDDIYTQYLGIPCQGIYDMAKGLTNFPGNLVVVAEEERLPATPPTSPGRTLNGSPIETEPTNFRENSLIRKSSQSSKSPNLPRPPPLLSTNLPHVKNPVQRTKISNTETKEMTHSLGQDSIPYQTVNAYNHELAMTERLCPSPKETILQSLNTENIDDKQTITTSGTRSSSPTDEQSIQCGQCKKHFIQRSMLHTHICSSITNKPYQCGHCDKRFSSPGEMTVHVAVHQEKKPFKCGYCSRSFTGATTLNNHVRMHTGEKPFDCLRCGKTFTKGLQLSRHQKIPGNCVSSMKYMHDIKNADCRLSNE